MSLFIDGKGKLYLNEDLTIKTLKIHLLEVTANRRQKYLNLLDKCQNVECIRKYDQ